MKDKFNQSFPPKYWYFYQDSKGYFYPNGIFTLGKNFNMMSFISWLKFSYPDAVSEIVLSQPDTDFTITYYTYDPTITSVCFQSMIDEYFTSYNTCLMAAYQTNNNHNISTVI